MKSFFFLPLLMVACSRESIKPPIIDQYIVENQYHGQKIKDPYRNLENLEDSAVISWLKAQEKFASNILKKIPGREKLIEKQKELNGKKPFDVWGTNTTYDNSFFYIKSIPNDSIDRLYYKETLVSVEKLLYDPSKYRTTSKEPYAINYFKPDWKGQKVAVSLSKRGEEISKIIVIDVTTGKVLPGVLKNCKPNIGGIQWLPDNSGFNYIYFPFTNPQDPNYGLNTKSLVYLLGSDPNIHLDVFSKDNNPELNLKLEDYPKIYIRENYENYVFGQVSGSSRFKDMYIKKMEELLDKSKPWKLLYKQSDMVERVLLDNKDLVFLSAKNASNYKICKTSVTNPDFDAPQILVSQDKEAVITDFAVTRNGIFFVRIKNGVEAKLFHYSKGEEKEIVLPKPSGTIWISSKGSKYDKLTVYTEGWLEEGKLYEYDLLNNQFQNIDIAPLIIYPEIENLLVEEIEVKSHDGVMVPLSIIYRKGIKKNGENPTLFYGYGSYGGAGSPFFSSNFLTWVIEGGILAVAHVRGGGEKGDAWYKGGFKTTKSNTWKDMIACTQYMIDAGFTTPDKSGILGSSAGGIMAGRAITDRPDLYKSAVMVSPAMNMLRSEIQPNGLNSIKEFGTVKKKDEFEALLEMDSYHHIKKGEKYPATLVTGGMKDGRVVIWDPAKFVARLQANNVSDNPVLFTVDFNAGHGGINSGKQKVYELYANVFSFTFWQTGHPDYQPKN